MLLQTSHSHSYLLPALRVSALPHHLALEKLAKRPSGAVVHTLSLFYASLGASAISSAQPAIFGKSFKSA